ncbi:MAG: fimbria/pilus periplasmic chaperone [Pantoea sp.]|uniref:Pilus assembly protein PapD n=1 Tax=Pantoea septica TaxID=472695 RepID=A0ABX3UPB1_9GAMM|nr:MULTISPECIES: fimbria/pilus periplasmic chaperone [Pantoea]MDU5779505.1 fimbria/pilus periplasmic chaperone [Pantoea sp.]ORM96411.1 pilus assembly protein PapD [Pantoea septica]
MSSWRITLAAALTLVSSLAWGGGVGLSATRIIFPSTVVHAALGVRNTATDTAWLIQSWIEDEKGTRTKDFIITPPLFLMNPKSENILRILINRHRLPEDRESLYWVTVKAIPQMKEEGGSNSLQFAAASRIKLFYRPESLNKEAADAWRKINFKKEHGKVIVSNSTPFFITLVNIRLDDKPVPSVMVTPNSSATLSANKGQTKKVSFQTINDYGALTDKTTILL